MIDIANAYSAIKNKRKSVQADSVTYTIGGNDYAFDSDVSSYTMLKAKAVTGTLWKTNNAGFILLSPTDVADVIAAIEAHIEGCFAREYQLCLEVENNTYTDSMLNEGWPGV